MKINEKVSVLTYYNEKTNKAAPYQIKWRNRTYTITEIGLHHTIKNGKTLHHIFSVTDNNTFFRLNLNTNNLHWIVEEIIEKEG